ncbi:nucleotidyltransferase domain-containing protein [Ferribacterium limneticum]|uniref:nucleotidyltransferase domain-containing protein n=1 Tax=Ferribacterium limneticum TaxID=76259 RepID=UPI001CFB1ABE|nr:nucleotidyltransferase family protein [Ferribacterium limneticum]UCV17295.1 nucleotidyltransferase family protein [Ferribacterium limneticum]
MTDFYPPLLVSVLLSPAGVRTLSERQWDLLIRQARRANLLGTLAARLVREDLFEAVPLEPKRHLESALLMVSRQGSAVRWELACISRALASEKLSAVVLKGAAYVVSGVQAGHGRIFSDVDILVRKADIVSTESALMIHGWQSAKSDPYDQKYYRQWMHEIPPMAHVTRGTTIDVHHSIVPETARIKVDSVRLFDYLRPLADFNNLFAFSPALMVLHSATHLFQEGELDNGLRDLFDIDALIREFGVMPDFWTELLDSGQETGASRFLYYALRYARSELGSPVPESALQRIEKYSPSPIALAVMDACYRRAFRPNHETCVVPGSGIMRRFIYLRSHWLRMPMGMLIPHLLRKAIIGFRSAEKKIPDANV